MAGTKTSKCRILVDEFDFSGSSNTLSIENTVEEIVFNVFQTEAQLKLPSLAYTTITQNGYYLGSAVGDLEAELNGRLGSPTGVFVSAILGTDAAIPVAYVQDSIFNAQLKVDAPLKGLITLSAKWPGAVEQTKRGYLVFTGTLAATGGQAIIDMGAAGALGGYAFIHVTGITGSAAAAAIKVQGATTLGFGSPVDHNTFTFSAVGAIRGALNTTVQRYIRVNCTSLGGATGLTVAIIVAVKGLTY